MTSVGSFFFSRFRKIHHIAEELTEKSLAVKKHLPEYHNSIDHFTKEPITVFTSIIGKKDNLIDDQVTKGANFIAFTNQKSKTWKTVKPYDKFKDDRRNSRIYKIMPHMFFNTEFSLWIDGNVKLKVPAQQIVDTFLKDKDIALWKHQNRDCVYAEAEACYKFNKDTPEALGEHIREYKKRGIPAHNGLYAATVIIRRHTKRINELNEKWWAEYSRYSKRDQISFPVAFPANEVNCIEEGTMWQNKYFERVNHITEA
jgi:hypothetical protein